MEAAMHFKFIRRTGVVRYSPSVSAPGKDVHNVDTFLGGFYSEPINDEPVYFLTGILGR
jgi:hypothetical protein